MTLDALYMPLPARSSGRRVTPLGDWPKASSHLLKLEKHRRYRENHRAQLAANERARRKAKREESPAQ